MPKRFRGVQSAAVASGAMIASGLLFAVPAGAATTSLVPATTPVPEITTVAGTGTGGYTGNGGPAVKAEINLPTGLAEDTSGSLYIGDTANNVVRKVVSPTLINKDIISTIAGTGSAGYSGDNGPATSAKLNGPSGVAIDTTGDVFVADTGNNRVRKISPAGMITTVAGNGASCGGNERSSAENMSSKTNIGNGGPATQASLCFPTGLAWRNGSLYISDSGHNEVRVVSSTGTINAFAGTGNFGPNGDGGPATKAQLAIPLGLAVDSLGNVYIADSANSKVRVVNSAGTISTFAGKGTPGFSGDGGVATSAQLLVPSGVGVDPSGHVFIADTGNQRIREVASGKISTYAGTGSAGFSGDGGPATSAKVNTPTGGITADGTAVFIADTGNNRIRGIFLGPPPVLPEVPFMIMLPAGGLLILGGGVWFMRRRNTRQRLTMAGAGPAL